MMHCFGLVHHNRYAWTAIFHMYIGLSIDSTILLGNIIAVLYLVSYFIFLTPSTYAPNVVEMNQNKYVSLCYTCNTLCVLYTEKKRETEIMR